ncbi:MAG: aminoglycoside phosphotransferase family protein [Tenericutes bacterium]|nr:aminoglycoside phosphotransferase family protein [Mycoplasmatota bacterium]
MNLEKIIAVRTTKTIYKVGQKVVKVFDQDTKKDEVLNEALNQARVELTNIDIPKIESVTMIDNKWAIVSEFISGVTLSRLMKEKPENLSLYLNQFVDLQINMHQTKPPLLNELNSKMQRKIELTDLIATTRYALRLNLESMPKKNCLCHGDFNPSNIIISDNNLAYILDWSHASLGDPLADVANTYLIFLMDGLNELGIEYLEMYCEKTDTDRDLVKRWLPLVAASSLQKSNPANIAFLKSWINK